MEIKEIEVAKIKISEQNVRKTDVEKGIEELSNSIKEIGLLQPIHVVETDDGFELIIGQRRLQAVKRLGWQKIPAIIMPKKEPHEKTISSLVENAQRVDLDPKDRAKAVIEIVERLGSYKTVAEVLGFSEPEVRKWTEYHGVYDEIKEMVSEKKITVPHAIRLTKHLDMDKAVEVAREMAKEEKKIHKDIVSVATMAPDLKPQEIIKRAKRPIGRKKFTVRFQTRIYEALMKAAAERGEEVDALLQEIVREWLQKEKAI